MPIELPRQVAQRRRGSARRNSERIRRNDPAAGDREKTCSIVRLRVRMSGVVAHRRSSFSGRLLSERILILQPETPAAGV
jgi:hypothetical protein